MNHANQTTSAAEEIAYLEAGLRLVHSKPGSEATTSNYGWLRDDPLTYTPIETTLIDIAHRLGQLAIEADNPDLGHWAADQGQLIAPDSEALHRTHMQAAAKAGDPNGIETAYRAAMRSTEALSPWEDIQTETDDLYTQLTGRKPHN